MSKRTATPKEAYHLGYEVARANFSADRLPNAERLTEQCKAHHPKAFAAGVQSYCNKWANDPYRNKNWTNKHPRRAALNFRHGLKVIRTV